MIKKIENNESPFLDELLSLVQSQLDEEINPADISFALAAMAIDVGLNFAPTKEIAFSVVLRAIQEVAENHAASENETVEGECVDEVDAFIPTGVTIH